MRLGQAKDIAASAAAPGLERWPLRFADANVEAAFRAHERQRNLTQARLAFVLIATIFLLSAPLDLLYIGRSALPFTAWRIAFTVVMPVVLAALTYLPYYNKRWPILVAFVELGIVFALTGQLIFADSPRITFMIVPLTVLASYMLLPLILMYQTVFASIASMGYLAALLFSAKLSAFDFLTVLEVTIAVNVLGFFALYRLEKFRRLEFLNLQRIEAERRRYRELLVRILPQSIADRLEAGEERIADDYDDATVLFADIVNFTEFSARYPANQVVELLERTFAAFDDEVQRLGLEKIKTIGDSYMAAGGLPKRRGDHAEAVARLALAIRAAANTIRGPDGAPIHVRIGIHSGAVIAGVIGEQRFQFDLWGDTVNTASRMEHLGAAGEIQVSDDLRQRLGDRFQFAPRGAIEVKGKGAMTTWYLMAENAATLAGEANRTE